MNGRVRLLSGMLREPDTVQFQPKRLMRVRMRDWDVEVRGFAGQGIKRMMNEEDRGGILVWGRWNQTSTIKGK